MNRRTWLKSATGAIAGQFMLDRASAQTIPGLRTFSLLVNDNGAHAATQVTDAFVHNGNIYYFASDNIEADPVFKIGCASFAGKMVWRRRLPYGLYNSIGMSEKGELLLLAITAGRHQNDPTLSVYSVVPGDRNPPQLNWLAAIPQLESEVSPFEPYLFAPFLKGCHFGAVSKGVSLSITTSKDALAHNPPATYPLAGHAYKAFDVFDQGGKVLVVNKETSEVTVCDPVRGVSSGFPIFGSAVSASRDALDTLIKPGANGALLSIAAAGIVGDSLHALLLSFANGVATYAWCDSNFAVAGTKEIPISLLPKAVEIRILQMGEEVGIVFSDGSVLAFPIPS